MNLLLSLFGKAMPSSEKSGQGSGDRGSGQGSSMPRCILSALRDVTMAGVDTRTTFEPGGAYDRCRTSTVDLAFRAALGKRLVEAAPAGQAVRVLYVGSGTRTYFDSLAADAGAGRFECVGIDPKYPAVPDGPHRHACSTWQDVEVADLAGPFHVCVIDVEPHGEETAIYDKFRRVLAPRHLVVAKCIGMMNTGGGYMADGFMRRLEARGALEDYLFFEDLDFRDVYCCCTTDDTAAVRPVVHHTFGLHLPRVRWGGGDTFRLCYGGTDFAAETLSRAFAKFKEHLLLPPHEHHVYCKYDFM